MRFVSPFADVDIADVSVYDYLFGDITEADADRVALVEVATGSSLQYGDLIRRIDSFAGWLAGRGIGVGDVVALHAHNSAELSQVEVEVMNFVARQVAPYKKVRQVEFVGAIPKSTTGKILRRELRTGHAGESAVPREVQVR